MQVQNENQQAPEVIEVRPVCPDDEAFLYELYRRTRADEIAEWALEPSQLEAIMRLQFKARQRHYEIAFPGLDDKVILRDSRRAGRIMVFRSELEIRLVDIALMPEDQGSGIGAALVSTLIDEARAGGKRLTLHVAKTNRATELYRRLGFSITSDLGADYRMEWQQQTEHGGSG